MPPPTISGEPTNQTVQAGATATFTVVASGNGFALTYQWYFQTAAITGATSSAYVITNAQSANAGTYYVNVNNGYGNVNSTNVTLTVSPSTQAAVWTGGGSDNNWSTGLNWLSGSAPAKEGGPEIVLAGSTRLTPNVDGNWGIAGLAFSNNAGAFALAGNILTIGTNGITNYSANTQIISNNIVLGASVPQISTGPGNLILAGGFNNAGVPSLFGGAGNITVSGGITGGGNVTMNGSGVLILSGNNGFSSTLAINSGTVQMGANNNLANSLNITLGGGRFASAGYSEVVGALTLTANSLIDLGGGSSVLQFANSSSVSWTTGATLLITNWNGSYSGGGAEQIFFGNNNNSLTAGQLAQIGFVGANGIQPARQLPSGEVVPVSADLAATVSGPVAIYAASNLTYTVTVTNLGPSQAANVVVSDTLPMGTTFVSASGAGSDVSGVVTWLIPSFASGAGSNFTVTVTAPLTGSLTNTVSCTAVTSDPNPANNNGSATNAQMVTTVIVSTAALANSSCVQVAASSALTWQQTVNSGNNRMLIVGVSLRQNGSSVTSITYDGIALTNLASSHMQDSVQLWGLVAPPVGTANIVANWNGNPDMSGWSGVFTNVNQSSPLRNTATASGNNQTPTVTINALAGDLVLDTISTAGAAVSAQPGSGQTQICNEATGSAPPNCLEASSWRVGAGSTAMSWTLGSSQGWDTAAIALSAAPAPPEADIATTVSGPATVFADTNYSYTVAVTNQGPSAASNIVVSDSLPAGVLFVSASGSGSNDAGVVAWSIPGLAAGVATNFTVTVTAPASGILTNLVLSTASTADPNPANNNGSAANAQVVTTVTPQADIATTVSGPATIFAGTNYSYMVAVTNQGPSTASNILVSDSLPAGVLFMSASGSGSNDAGVVAWSIPGLAADTATNFTITVTAPASGMLVNTVASSAATSDPNPANNNGSAPNAQVVTTVTPQADIATTVSGPATVFAAANYSYMVAVTNQGPSTASNIVVSDSLPAGVLFVSASGNGSNDAGVVAWSIPGLAAGMATNFTVTVTAPASGTLTNSVLSMALTGDPNPANNNGSAPNAQVVTTVTPQADIATTVSGPATVFAAANYSYMVAVTNQGPSTASNIVVSDSLPAGVLFVSASGNGSNDAGVVVWSIPGLAADAATNFTVTVTAPASGTLTNSVLSMALTSDPNPANNNGSAANARVVTTVTPQADIATTVSGPATVFAAANYSYMVAVTNQGPSTASNIVVSDSLPAGVLFVSASGSGSNDAGVVAWSIPGLAAGAATNFTVTVTAPASGMLVNTVASSAATSDPNPANNNGSAANAQVITQVQPLPMLTGQWLATGFQLQFSAPSNTTITIEASTNLVDWQILVTTNSADGLIDFTDEDAANYPQRFYRSSQ